MAKRRLEKRLQIPLTLDIMFDREWNFMKKQLQKNISSLKNFDDLWRILKFINNDWRKIDMGGDIFYSRARGLNINNMDNFKPDDDYFLGSNKLIEYIRNQVQFRGGIEYLPFLPEPISSQQQTVTTNSTKKSMSKNDIDDLIAGAIESSVSIPANLTFVSASTIEAIVQKFPDMPVLNQKSVQNKQPVETHNSITQWKDTDLIHYAYRPPYTFEVGDKVDVAIDDIFCPATIIRVNEKYVRVHYLGWEDPKYDANIRDMSLLYRAFTFVQRIKVWASLSEKILDWPCVAYIRPAVNNCREGKAYLKKEKCVFVMPMLEDFPDISRWSKGLWIDTYSVRPFSRALIRKKLLPAPLEEKLEEAMSALEMDPDSRVVQELRFAGSYEYNTSTDLWSNKSNKHSSKQNLSGQKRGLSENNQCTKDESANVKSTEETVSIEGNENKRIQIYRSKHNRRGSIVFDEVPDASSPEYISLCASAKIQNQLGCDDSTRGKEIRAELKAYISNNMNGKISINHELDQLTSCTYVVANVGCHISFDNAWHITAHKK